jgi:hypothetical protein
MSHAWTGADAACRWLGVRHQDALQGTHKGTVAYYLVWRPPVAVPFGSIDEQVSEIELQSRSFWYGALAARVHRRRHVAGAAILLGQDSSICEKFIAVLHSPLMKSCLIWCYGRDLFCCYLMVLSKAWFCGYMSSLYPCLFTGPVGLHLIN